MAAAPAVAVRRYLLAGAATVLATGVAFRRAAGSARLHGPDLSQVMVFGVAPLVRRIGWPDPLRIAAASIAVMAVVALARRLGAIAPVVVLTAAFLVFAAQNQRDYLKPASAIRGQEHVLGDVLASLGPPASLGCAAY